MADLFGNRGFWQDSGCVSTEKKEGKTEDSDLVLICFQISERDDNRADLD